MSALKLLRPNEVASLLQVHRTTLWRWIQKGTFPKPIKIGSHAVAFRQSEVEDWLASRPTST